MEWSDLWVELSLALILECWCDIMGCDCVNPVWLCDCGHTSDNLQWVFGCDHLQWVCGYALPGHVNTWGHLSAPLSALVLVCGRDLPGCVSVRVLAGGLDIWSGMV